MNDRAPVISVIVPVYKVEDYLSACVDSILAQTYQNLEIILVDDGSPDGCGAICDAYAEKDTRVKVIHKENGGVSSARNAGLDIATGELIGFIDSDDIALPTLYEELYTKLIETNSDMVSCAYTRVYSQDDPSAPDEKVSVVSFDREGALCAMLHRKPFGSHLWCKLYRAETVRNVRFDTSITNSEDLLFIAESILNCKKVTFFSKHLYNYLQRQGSALHREFTARSMTHYDAYSKVLDLTNELGLSDKTKASVQAACVLCCIYLAYEVAPQKEASKKFVPTIKKNLRRHVSKKSLAVLHRSRRIQACLLCVSHTLFKLFFKLSR